MQKDSFKNIVRFTGNVFDERVITFTSNTRTVVLNDIRTVQKYEKLE